MPQQNGNVNRMEYLCGRLCRFRYFFVIFEDMKIRVFSLLLFLSVMLLPAVAQNNPYEINDECFIYFSQAESLLGKDGFQIANDALMRSAIAKGDTKAQTLYYVERLKNITRLVNEKNKKQSPREMTAAEEQEMLKAMDELKTVARELGYPQYFYYSYDLVQNCYFNAGQFLKVTELVQEMQETAERNHEEYGIWMSNRYMVNLYVAQNDYISAKKFVLKALDIYEKAEDPTIRRQSVTRLFCDLADTYPIGHDSVRVNIGKAERACKQHMDTLRVQYHRAKLYAFDGDIPAYERARDYCKNDPFIPQITSTYQALFDSIDHILFGKEGEDPELNIKPMMAGRLREVKYIANIAEKYGYKDLAFDIEKQLVVHDEQALASANQSKLTELEARLGNNELTARLGEQERKALQTSRLILLLVAIILIGILVFSWIYIINLKKANEKVKLANEAKTRFVQNMSHEVRTPLNAIVGFSQLLALPDGTFPPEEKDEFSGHIINNTKMLTMLLDDILNASAMDSGNYRITYEEGEMHFMSQAAISSAEHRLQPGVRMYYAPESEEPFTFRTDPRRVQQILINFLTNACKHTTQGEIKLASSLTENPGYVTFSVTDTGPGVPADQAEKIFDRFTKLNEFVQGTGLGLSICRDIASRMGSKVFMDTTYTGGGARFVFLVPVTPPEEESIVAK